jgi:hypothetical protein
VRISVGPLDLAQLSQLLGSRLDVTFPRPTLKRIHAASGGNPFFALREIHRALAFIVADPEARARHLALAAVGPDEDVAAALDKAARLARERVPSVPVPVSDMSAAAYAATHPAAIPPATDMSAAAYAATHPVVVPTATSPANDISTVASRVAIAIATLAAVALLGLGALVLLRRPRTTS